MSYPSQEDIIVALSNLASNWRINKIKAVPDDVDELCCAAMAEIGRLEQERSRLLGEIAEWKADRNRLQSANQSLMDRLDNQRQSIQTLMAERDRYREALEVYADEGNWHGCEDDWEGDIDFTPAIGGAGYEIAQRALGGEPRNEEFEAHKRAARGRIAEQDALNREIRAEQSYAVTHGLPDSHPLAHIAIQIQDERGGEG